MKERREAWTLAALAVMFAAAGVAVRLWHVGRTPMWLDEAYSAYAAARGFGFLWHVVPRYETHPPFYYSLLRGWTMLFGDGLLAERALGLTAGLLTPPAIAWSADAAGAWLGWDRRRRRRLTFVAFALACVSIPLVGMSREVRPYPVMILVYALALRASLAVLRARDAGRPLPGGAYAAYLVCLELMLWLHNLGPMWGAALGIAMSIAVRVCHARPVDLAWLAAGHAAVLILYLPALAILADQAPTWVRSTWLRFSGRSLSDHLPVLYAVPGWQAVAAVILLALAAILLAAAPRGRRLLALLLTLAVVPTALSVLLSIAVAPVFITRTLTPVAVPTILLLAIGAVAWGTWPARMGAGAAVLLASNLLAVNVQSSAGPPMQDWYGAVAWLERRHRPGDLILAYPNEGALPLDRALGDRELVWAVRPIPTAVPALGQGGWTPTGSRGVVSLPNARLEEIAHAPDIAGRRRVWLLRLGAATYDPGDMFLTALREGRRITDRRIDGPIDIIGLERR